MLLWQNNKSVHLKKAFNYYLFIYLACSCNPEHSDGCEEGSGHCHCKVNFHGENCEQCAEGYYSFPFCVRKY